MNALECHDQGSSTTATRQKILVVNDSPDFLTFMREFLTIEGGFEVSTYDQSERVLEQVTNALPDLIILDIAFRQGPSGLEVANQLADVAETAGIPVLFCTALTARDLGSQALELAASRNQRILYKPFDVDDLLRIVDELLQKPERSQSGAA